ncbi:hypothetical protein V8G54_028593 [Vigna mungo]|uniref:Serine aminopeptidase S33 domain-containing protein n=1 Tax=Vigna mungo TaxID=3915 RepID=A0AAQ3MSH8_VIGMU
MDTKFKYFEVPNLSLSISVLFLSCMSLFLLTVRIVHVIGIHQKRKRIETLQLQMGYAMECSRFMRGVAETLANAGYAVFGLDYEGHGRSAGVRCLITKFDNIVDDCEDFFKIIGELQEYKGKPRFLYGDSMGGSVCLLLHKRDPSFWDGTILVAPMCKISDKLVKPFPIVVNVLTKFEDIIPKWKIVPTKNIISTAFKDRAKREAVRIPFLVLQGGKDKVTDPEISRALYEKASSKDKTIKMYMGMCHGVATGESDENIARVFRDIVAWLDERSTKPTIHTTNYNGQVNCWLEN